MSAPGKRILIVDDDPGVAGFIGKVAEGAGYEACVTFGASEFRTRFFELRPEIVVLDLAMPQTDGVELLRFLADNRCTAQILIVSGVDGTILEAAQRLGNARGLRMAGTIAKPVRANDLGAILKNLAKGDTTSTQA